MGGYYGGYPNYPSFIIFLILVLLVFGSGYGYGPCGYYGAEK